MLNKSSMHRHIGAALLLLLTTFIVAGERPDYALVIHGGAGTIRKANMSPEKEKAYTEALRAALEAGEAILKNGGSSEDAVIATIKIMEDSPLFNAGVGAVFTHEGKNELDASLMRGNDLAAGAVAGVRTVKNPIELAQKVMNESRHVLLTGRGAETFAKDMKVAQVDNKHFFTQERWDRLQSVKKSEESGFRPKKHGTVGCVALDKKGNIAAGTSTGGLTNKRWGRVGDSPIIGAGTYANNETCGVSATGQGEYFIRAAIAYDIHAQMAYNGKSAQQAADLLMQDKLTKMGGLGGVIVMDAKGNIAWSFNTEGMYRASLKAGEKPIIRMYED